MLLPRLESGVEVVDSPSAAVVEWANAVDHNGVRFWRAIGGTAFVRVGLTVESVEGSVVNPVSHQDGTNVNVPFITGRPMNDKRPRNAIGILKREMAVIPRVPVLGRVESVSVLLAKSNGTLRDSVDAVHFV